MTVSAEYLRSILLYEPQIGVFTWRHRPSAENKWNARFAGAAAGHISDRGYIEIRIDKRLYYAHRLAWLYVHGCWPKEQIDHINCIKGDNRIANLRQATTSQNGANVPTTTVNKSGLKGVYFAARLHKPWVAQISKNKRRIYLGCFETPEKAHRAYTVAAKRLHGEYARAA